MTRSPLREVEKNSFEGDLEHIDVVLHADWLERIQRAAWAISTLW
jgi:hypothetical protein